MRPFIFALLALFLVDVAMSLDQKLDCNCRIHSDKQITGVHVAGPMKFPWVASLQWKQNDPLEVLAELFPENGKILNHFCDGTLINERFILTVANCVADKKPDQIRVAFGSNDLVTLFDEKHNVDVRAIHMYQHYKKNSTMHNIALVELVEPLKFNEFVQPACLPARYRDHYHGDLRFSGFGSLENTFVNLMSTEGGESSRYLKAGNTYDRSEDLKCVRRVEICTSDLKHLHADRTVQHTSDARRLEQDDRKCLGDSGGPLHYSRGGRSTVIGLNSHGISETENDEETLCDDATAFTRVSAYLTWIKRTTDDDDGDNLCFGDDFSNLWK